MSETGADAFRAIRHDLRTPINHIVGYTELLLEEVADTGLASLEGDLRRIHGAGGRLLAMVNEFFAAGRETIEPDELRRTYFELRTPLDWVIGYSDLLQQEVVDLGRPELVDDLRRIHRAGEHMLRLVDIALGLVEADGWQPGAAPIQPTPSPIDPPTGDLDAATGTILVVDDNEPNRDMLARRLERQGHRVVAVEDGPAALAALAAGGVDLVLLDIVMPGMDGYQVCNAIRQAPATRILPVVMITASDEQEKARAIAAGADDLVPKPFNPAELFARVRSLLRIKRYHDTIAELNRTLEARVRTQVDQIERLGKLRRFLSPQLADLVVASGGDAFLRSHRREIACVFCDLRGFTAFTETAEPEEVTEVLGAYHDEMGALIREYGATVDHFAGDGLLVFFNDPVACDDPARRAIRMAVAMQARMSDLKAVWKRRGHSLGFGVGVTLGYATLGQVGFEGRYDYSANGATVNLSARLCAEAADGQIIATQRVVAALDDAVAAEPLGEMTLKGFHRPVAAFNVTGVRDDPGA